MIAVIKYMNLMNLTIEIEVLTGSERNLEHERLLVH